MARRSPNVFNLSFLDCMSCGFGAVILFFMIINTGSVRDTDERTAELQQEARRLALEVVEGRQHLVVVRNSLEQVEQEQVETQGRSERVRQLLRDTTLELAQMERQTLAKEENIAALKADLESLEKDEKRLEAGGLSEDVLGDALRTRIGQGDRQYLTGLKVGGERILFLVDASTSMLDDTVVGAIRRRHLSNAEKRESKKWQRAVDTVDWLTTQIPASSKFQIYAFNVKPIPLVEGSEGEWIEASAPGALDGALQALEATVPGRGTSLHHAFAPLATLDPPPDNVYLLTDGLPTQGSKEPLRSTVSPSRRMGHFKSALERLPSGIPVNVILYPMEGDPDAAISYWLLAQRTGGSFLSPSRDWP
jgi:hypothetical protein